MVRRSWRESLVPLDPEIERTTRRLRALNKSRKRSATEYQHTEKGEVENPPNNQNPNNAPDAVDPAVVDPNGNGGNGGEVHHEHNEAQNGDGVPP